MMIITIRQHVAQIVFPVICAFGEMPRQARRDRSGRDSIISLCRPERSRRISIRATHGGLSVILLGMLLTGCGRSEEPERPAPRPMAEKRLVPVAPEVAVVIEAPVRDARDTIPAGFEDVGRWRVASWSDPAITRNDDWPASQGRTPLRVTPVEAPEGKVIVAAPVATERLSECGSFQVDVYVEHDRDYPAVMTIAVLGTDDAGQHVWIESAPRVLKKGWNRSVLWDLYAADWKTEATKWHLCVTPVGIVSKGTFQLLIHGLDRGQAVILDGLRINSARTDRAIEADVTAEKWLEPDKYLFEDDMESGNLPVDNVMAHVFSTLAGYAADMRSLGRIEAADAADEEVKRMILQISSMKTAARTEEDLEKELE